MNDASPSLQKKFEELKQVTYRAVTVGNCIACGTCIKFCPLKIRDFNSKGKAITIISEQSCGGCSVCFQRCPQKAISLIQFKK